MTNDGRAKAQTATRRKLLAGLGTGVAAGLAGCGGGGDTSSTPTDADDGVDDAFTETDDGNNSSGNGTDQTPTEGGGFSEAPLDRAAVERAIAERANEIRTANGAGLLDWDEDLREIARDHSEDMIHREFFDHVDPMGRDIGDRYQDAGYDCVVQTGGGLRDGGETIARITYAEPPGREQIAIDIVEQWRNSDRPRSELLERYWSVHGVGIALDPTADDTVIYVTQNFC